jgi:hypothetical protein
MPCINLMGPIKDCLVFMIIPCNLGLSLCWVAMLSCFTWVMVVLMNNNVEHALSFISLAA